MIFPDYGFSCPPTMTVTHFVQVQADVEFIRIVSYFLELEKLGELLDTFYDVC